MSSRLTAVATASTEDMQLACDPSDPGLQSRTSASQVNDWLQGCARGQTSNLVKFQQLVKQQQQQQQRHNEGAPTTSSTFPTAVNINKTSSTIACSMRRLRHFASSASATTTSTSASFTNTLIHQQSKNSGNSSLTATTTTSTNPLQNNDDSFTPSSLMMLTHASLGGVRGGGVGAMSNALSANAAMSMMTRTGSRAVGGGGAGTGAGGTTDAGSGLTIPDLFFGDLYLQQFMNSSNNAHVLQSNVRNNMMNNTASSSNTQRLFAAKQSQNDLLFTQASVARKRRLTGANGNAIADSTMTEEEEELILSYKKSIDKVLDASTALQVCQQSALPSCTPLVDVEIARVARLLESVSQRTASMQGHPKAIENFNHGSDGSGDWLASRLHRQILRSVQAHPLSKARFVMPAGKRIAISNNNNTDNNSNNNEDDNTATTTRQRIVKRVSLKDVIHGKRIRVPVRCECCCTPGLSDEEGDQQEHPPLCLYSIFLLAIQYQRQQQQKSQDAIEAIDLRLAEDAGSNPTGTATSNNNNSNNTASVATRTTARGNVVVKNINGNNNMNSSNIADNNSSNTNNANLVGELNSKKSAIHFFNAMQSLNNKTIASPAIITNVAQSVAVTSTTGTGSNIIFPQPTTLRQNNNNVKNPTMTSGNNTTSTTNSFFNTISFDSSISEIPNMHEPFMTCPVCNAPVALSQLYIDQTMTKILKMSERCSQQIQGGGGRDFVDVDVTEFPNAIELLVDQDDEMMNDTRRRQRDE